MYFNALLKNLFADLVTFIQKHKAMHTSRLFNCATRKGFSKLGQ